MKLSILDQAPIAEGSDAAAALRQSVALARLADRLGYERYWMAEHHGLPVIAASAPEVMAGVIAQATTGIGVGAGAVILPHQAPLKAAEAFLTLEALFPGRIDLGVGRGPGAGEAEIAALSRGARFSLDGFPQQLLELKAFLDGGGFPKGHPFARVLAQPRVRTPPPLWLVGATPWGARGAAHLGLPYAFAHFLGPQHTREALAAYRDGFQPSASLAAPQAILAIGVVCAETDAEADRLAASARAVARRQARGEAGLVPTVEDALRELAADPAPPEPDPGHGRRTIVGSPQTVRARLQAMADELGVDEVMVLTATHDPAARLRSYELLAEAFALAPRHVA